MRRTASVVRDVGGLVAQLMVLAAVCLMLLAPAGADKGLDRLAVVASQPTSPPGQGECEHGNSGQECRPDPQPTNGQDCEEHGPNEGGVNEDHCLGSPSPTPSPTPTETPTPTPEPTVSPTEDPTPEPSVLPKSSSSRRPGLARTGAAATLAIIGGTLLLVGAAFRRFSSK